MSNVKSLPDLSVVLDLDVEERDPSTVKPPFVVKVEGRSITFADPDEMDWRDLAAIETPADMLRVALPREDAKYLQGLSLPAWKFSRLMESYYQHYGLEDRIQEAQRRARFGG